METATIKVCSSNKGHETQMLAAILSALLSKCGERAMLACLPKLIKLLRMELITPNLPPNPSLCRIDWAKSQRSSSLNNITLEYSTLAL